MKKLFLALLFVPSLVFAASPIQMPSSVFNGAISIGDSLGPDPKSILDIKSTTKGVLFPRMTTTQMNAISSPPTGLAIWNTTDNAFYVYRGSGWVQIGAGGGGGGSKNYVASGDFENNSVNGWTATGCATITNGLPACNGSGGAAFSSSNGGRTKGSNTTNPAIASSSPLSGLYSLNFQTSGAGTIGDGYVSPAYAIDISDRGHVLAFSLNYKVMTGTPEMSGTSSNTYAVAIYDTDHNVWVIPDGVFNFIGDGAAIGSFQLPSDSTQFQIFIYSPVAPTGSSALYFDDVKVGPGQSVGSSGRTIAARTHLSANTTATALATFPFDTIDYDNAGGMSGGAYTIPVSGYWKSSGALTTNLTVLELYVNGSFSHYLASLPSGSITAYTSEDYFNAGDIVTIRITDTTTVYGSSGQQSYWNISQIGHGGGSSGGGPVIVASYYLSSSSSSSVIPFDTVLFDSSGLCVAGAGFKCTAKETGYYHVEISGASASGTNNIGITKNGSTYAVLFAVVGSSGNWGGSGIDVQLNAGEYIQPANFGSITVLGQALASGTTMFSMHKIANPTTALIGDQTISGTYGTTGAQSIPNATPTTLTFSGADETYAGLCNISTGVCTAPVTGRYEICGSPYMQGAVSGCSVNIGDGSGAATVLLAQGTTGTINGCSTKSYRAGDQFSVVMYCTGSGMQSYHDGNTGWVVVNRIH